MSEFVDHMLALLEPMGGMRSQRMFGGFCLYHRDVPMAIIADDVLYFKVDSRNRADYDAAGSQPFTYDKKGKAMQLSYWAVPLEILEDAEQLLLWAEKACQAGLAAKKTQGKDS